MSFSYTNSESQTFTITHAKHLASKLATDLKRLQRFYGSPSDYDIAQYENEMIEFLKGGYLDTVTYGFKRNDQWIEPTLRYTAKDLQGMNSSDDDPGRVSPNADISGASFYSFMSYNSSYHALSDNEKSKFNGILPFLRSGAPEPSIKGYLSSDKTYSSGGKALNRSSIKNY